MKNEYKVMGDYTIVYLNYKGQTLECLIDTEDIPLIQDYRWYGNASKSGTVYARSTQQKDKKSVLMHSLILGTREMVDHKDTNGLNNCRNNLRATNRSLNALNKGKSWGSSGIRGVFWYKKYQKWCARCSGKHLGYFEDKYEAGRAVTKYIMSIDSISVPRTPILIEGNL